MKRILSGMLCIILIASTSIIPASAKTTEMRAAWVTTVYNQDWPTTKGNVEKQKEEFTIMLDKLKEVGINAVMVQLRPKSDALYKSNINPWSDVLTGTQGKDPGYDPLKFMIEEAHKRGMELHGWFNPYRITTKGTDLSALASNNPARLNPSWAIEYNDALYYDPGNPDVIRYLVDTVMEVVKNYNIDGIHFDDYFYPGNNFNDDTTYSNYGNGINKDDWRRDNVNKLIKQVKTSIKGVKSSVDFGISPAGIWKNYSSDPAGSKTNGNESYYAHYADSVTWIKNGWIDYIAPQIYWTRGYKVADYSVLAEWWANQVKGTEVKLYIGQGVYRDSVANEITEQLTLNRQYDEIKGSIFFSTKHILENTKLQKDIKKFYIDNMDRRKIIGTDRYETSALVSKSGWQNGSDTVLLVNGYALADGVTATPLASAYNAPILLTPTDWLDNSTINELKRLNPKNIIIVGGTGVVSNSVVNELKKINSNYNISRIGGIDRYETSLQIAKRLDTIVDVNKAYICYGYGEPDALSISSKAGMDKSPIILSRTAELGTSVFNWLKSEKIDDAYFIGGIGILGNEVVNEVNSITTKDVRNNRLSGSDRYDTNAAVIKRFFSNEKQDVIMATKGEELADALTSGPFATKQSAPIVMINYELSNGQVNSLKDKYSKILYQIGGGISERAIEQLIHLIN